MWNILQWLSCMKSATIYPKSTRTSTTNISLIHLSVIVVRFNEYRIMLYSMASLQNGLNQPSIIRVTYIPNNSENMCLSSTNFGCNCYRDYQNK